MAISVRERLIIAKRREFVALCRLRNMTIDQITDALSKPIDKGGLRNPRSNKPYDRATIARDIQELEREAKANAAATAADHRARQFDELQQLKAQAWRTGAMNQVLRALDLEMRLLGSDAPRRVDVGVSFDYDTVRALSVLEHYGWSKQALVDQFQQFIRDAAARYESGGMT